MNHSGAGPITRRGSGSGGRDARGLRVTLWIAALCGLGLLIGTAWMSDDAYITLRTVDNVWLGYGPRWNAMERVQAYTHPLWMLLLAAAYGVTREPQLTTLAVSAVCTIAAVTIAVTRIAPTPGRALVLLALLLASKTFVEFSTSGLENPLTHLLVTLFCWQLWRDTQSDATADVDAGLDVDANVDVGLRRLRRLSVLAGLIALNRLDSLALIGPLLAAEVITFCVGPMRTRHATASLEDGDPAESSAVARARRVLRAGAAVAVGFLPLLAWELFSLFYYGQWFPNTAYAKLWAGVPAHELWTQGLHYLRDALIVDRVLLPAIATAIVWSLWRGLRGSGSRARGRSRDATVGLALLTGLAYVVAAGGDFMSGRFLSPAFLVAALWLGRRLPLDGRVPAIATALALTLLSATSAQSPWRVWHVPKAGDPLVTHGHGIIDERALYHPHTGLVPFLRGTGDPATFSWGATGRLWRRGVPRVAIFEAVGLLGYYSGPGVHIIDPIALADPLLARLPPSRSRRVGHFTRDLPPGYVATIERCLGLVFPRAQVTPRMPSCIDAPDRVNLIEDPRIAALYDRLALITQAPLLDGRRLRAIVGLPAGRSSAAPASE